MPAPPSDRLPTGRSTGLFDETVTISDPVGVSTSPMVNERLPVFVSSAIVCGLMAVIVGRFVSGLPGLPPMAMLGRQLVAIVALTCVSIRSKPQTAVAYCVARIPQVPYTLRTRIPFTEPNRAIAFPFRSRAGLADSHLVRLCHSLACSVSPWRRLAQLWPGSFA